MKEIQITISVLYFFDANNIKYFHMIFIVLLLYFRHLLIKRLSFNK